MSAKKVFTKRKESDLYESYTTPRLKDSTDKDAKRQRIVMAFAEYRDRYGDCKVKEHFTIEIGDPSWPVELHGIKLGKVLDNIRYQGCYKEIHQTLIDMGVILQRQHASPDYPKIYEALVAFKAVNGHLKMTFGFQVPHNDRRYPERTWGLNLGCVVNNIRHYNYYEKYHDELRALGLDLSVKRRRNFNTILNALSIYQQIHGNLEVPMKYTIPDNTPQYPEEAWGMNLGITVQGIRAGKSYAKYRPQLEALGLEFRDITSRAPGHALLGTSSHGPAGNGGGMGGASSSSSSSVPIATVTAHHVHGNNTGNVLSSNVVLVTPATVFSTPSISAGINAAAAAASLPLSAALDVRMNGDSDSDDDSSVGGMISAGQRGHSASGGGVSGKRSKREVAANALIEL